MDQDLDEREMALGNFIISEKINVQTREVCKNTNQVMQKAKFMRVRARVCRRMKDLLHLLRSYPMKPETDPADLFLLQDNFTELNRMIKRLDNALEGIYSNTNNVKATPDLNNIVNGLGELMENDIPAVLKSVEYCLAKYNFDIELLYARARMGWDAGEGFINKELKFIENKGADEEWNDRVVHSGTIRQVLHTVNEAQLKVIGICSQKSRRLIRALEDLLPLITSMFEVVINVSIAQCPRDQVQSRIAEEIHRLLGTDISLPLEEALKSCNNFLLLLRCGGSTRLDLHELLLPKHGSVMLAVWGEEDVYHIMPVDLEIRMEDHLLQWGLFRHNLRSFIFQSISLRQRAKELIEACHSHLLAIIMLARAIKRYDVDAAG